MSTQKLVNMYAKLDALFEKSKHFRSATFVADKGEVPASRLWEENEFEILDLKNKIDAYEAVLKDQESLNDLLSGGHTVTGRVPTEKKRPSFGATPIKWEPRTDSNLSKKEWAILGTVAAGFVAIGYIANEVF